jgi:hypothetical protein
VKRKNGKRKPTFWSSQKERRNLRIGIIMRTARGRVLLLFRQDGNTMIHR